MARDNRNQQKSVKHREKNTRKFNEYKIGFFEKNKQD